MEWFFSQSLNSWIFLWIVSNFQYTIFRYYVSTLLWYNSRITKYEVNVYKTISSARTLIYLETFRRTSGGRRDHSPACWYYFIAMPASSTARAVFGLFHALQDSTMIQSLFPRQNFPKECPRSKYGVWDEANLPVRFNYFSSQWKPRDYSRWPDYHCPIHVSQEFAWAHWLSGEMIKNFWMTIWFLVEIAANGIHA